jgi:2-phosphoglycerate kinase
MREVDPKFQTNDFDLLEDHHELIQTFDHNCKMIRKGVQVDILKCLSEGKPVIIEGVGLQPNLYIEELTNIPHVGDDKMPLIASYINNETKLKKA